MDYHIRDILKRYVRNDALNDGYILQQIKKYWYAQMGSTIVSRTSKIHFRDGLLSIFITSAPLKHDLFNSRTQIIEKINTHLGEDVVKEVVVR